VRSLPVSISISENPSNRASSFASCIISRTDRFSDDDRVFARRSDNADDPDHGQNERKSSRVRHGEMNEGGVTALNGSTHVLEPAVETIQLRKSRSI
jgi:hypothetical protein